MSPWGRGSPYPIEASPVVPKSLRMDPGVPPIPGPAQEDLAAHQFLVGQPHEDHGQEISVERQNPTDDRTG